MGVRLYNLTLCTFGLAWVHFMSEWKLYKTAGLGGGLLSPIIVASMSQVQPQLTLATSLAWMTTQRDYYLRQDNLQS